MQWSVRARRTASTGHDRAAGPLAPQQACATDRRAGPAGGRLCSNSGGRDRSPQGLIRGALARRGGPCRQRADTLASFRASGLPFLRRAGRPAVGPGRPRRRQPLPCSTVAQRLLNGCWAFSVRRPGWSRRTHVSATPAEAPCLMPSRASHPHASLPSWTPPAARPLARTVVAMPPRFQRSPLQLPWPGPPAPAFRQRHGLARVPVPNPGPGGWGFPSPTSRRRVRPCPTPLPSVDPLGSAPRLASTPRERRKLRAESRKPASAPGSAQGTSQAAGPWVAGRAEGEGPSTPGDSGRR